MYACVSARGAHSMSLTNITLRHGAAAALCLLGYCIQQVLAAGMTEKKLMNLINCVHNLNVKQMHIK